jgi:glucosamine--fructose-6-phosphate aminotransferase (isomerizing)
MAEDMAAQPEVLSRLAADASGVVQAMRRLRPDPFCGTLLVARGSSAHAALAGRYVAELATARPAAIVAPSVYTRYGGRMAAPGFVAVALSQSGATPDVVAALRRLREGGARTVAIVNDVSGPLAEEAELVLALGAGPELAVPATKTVTAEMALVAVATAALGEPDALRAAGLLGREGGLEELFASAARAVSGVLADPSPADALAARFASEDRLVVLGRGLGLAVALEVALKLKEAARVLAEALSSTEARHGPVAAFAGRVPVLAIDLGGPAGRDTEALVRRLRSGGVPVAISAAGRRHDLPFPAVRGEVARAVAATVRGQQLAFAWARAAGLDPDRPEALKKVTRTR